MRSHGPLPVAPPTGCPVPGSRASAGSRDRGRSSLPARLGDNLAQPRSSGRCAPDGLGAGEKIGPVRWFRLGWHESGHDPFSAQDTDLFAALHPRKHLGQIVLNLSNRGRLHVSHNDARVLVGQMLGRPKTAATLCGALALAVLPRRACATPVLLVHGSGASSAIWMMA